MKCKNCGTEIPDLQPYCPKCGYVRYRAEKRVPVFLMSLLLCLAGTAALVLIWYFGL
ncbi:MAG: zinc ribbon domain-containing protein [Candidatus Choladocola sp.]|nr:zinc ribbon domain-containing protein [Candidatus Choladocola sp.]